MTLRVAHHVASILLLLSCAAGCVVDASDPDEDEEVSSDEQGVAANPKPKIYGGVWCHFQGGTGFCDISEHKELCHELGGTTLPTVYCTLGDVHMIDGEIVGP